MKAGLWGAGLHSVEIFFFVKRMSTGLFVVYISAEEKNPQATIFMALERRIIETLVLS